MQEIWKPVPSRHGIMVSSLGRVLLPERKACMPNGGSRTYHTKPCFGTVTRASKNARHCYYGIFARFYGNMKVHRLVCEAFHGPQPIDKPIVIHKDENALNNCSDNLRWGTQKENLNAPGFIAYCRSRVGKNSPTVKFRANQQTKSN